MQGDGVTLTAADSNPFTLRDMSGNVAEWVQDRYQAMNSRALRGGSWANFAAQGVWIRNVDRNFAAPSLAWREIGFRAVRVNPLLGDANGDGLIDASDYTFLYNCSTGPGGGPVLPGCNSVDFEGDGDVDLKDFAAFANLIAVP
jgi:hypothetical protein